MEQSDINRKKRSTIFLKMLVRYSKGFRLLLNNLDEYLIEEEYFKDYKIKIYKLQEKKKLIKEAEEEQKKVE